MKFAQSLIVALFALLLSGMALAADVPTLDQVYQAAQAGRLAEARQMMGVVLKAHPGSGKAHYVEAQILAASRDYAGAAAELQKAERLEPGLPFVKQASVDELRARIAAGAGSPMAAQKSAGLPWGWIILVLGGVLLLALFLRRRASAAPYQQVIPAAGNSYGPGAYNGPMPPAAPMGGGGLGSSLGTGIATGLGVGAGIVAGEALAHSLFDRNSGTAAPTAPVAPPAAGDGWTDGNYDMGGNDFGLGQNDASSWDDGTDIGGDFSSGDDWS